MKIIDAEKMAKTAAELGSALAEGLSPQGVSFVLVVAGGAVGIHIGVSNVSKADELRLLREYIAREERRS